MTGLPPADRVTETTIESRSLDRMTAMSEPLSVAQIKFQVRPLADRDNMIGVCRWFFTAHPADWISRQHSPTPCPVIPVITPLFG